LKLFDENLVPLCASCVFGTSHRKPWRSKASSKSICCDKDNQPGAGTSTDQIISGQPVLAPQISGHLTNRRIQGATIYSDYYSDFIYVHLMESMSGEEILQSKCAYERVAAAHGVHVKRYHLDNGRFGENFLRAACDEQGWEITFCGVGAHHQNGIAENRIKLLTLKSRTMLLHAKRHWLVMAICSQDG
jgi:hypothetical protein